MENINVISSYTSAEAEADGILFNIVTVNPAWDRGIFNYITTNLMNQGYLHADGKVNIPNLLDLLNQANQMVKLATNNFQNVEGFDFCSGSIEMPSGKRQKIFIGQNETGKFTIMLPEDY